MHYIRSEISIIYVQVGEIKPITLKPHFIPHEDRKWHVVENEARMPWIGDQP
jgi:hypothetical protein